jgi:tagaturonate epimerase
MAEMSRPGLLAINGLDVLPRSVVAVSGAEAGLAKSRGGLRLAVLDRSGSPVFAGLEGAESEYGGRPLLLGPASAGNLEVLRALLPWLCPRTLQLQTSVGFGDRLGLATPGHIRALQDLGGGIAPVFAQQSIREMERTGRSPQEVMDDAAWGVFAESWREGFGADADHLKTTENVDACVAAGYTFFTFDPGEYVVESMEDARPSELRAALERLPWDELEDSERDLRKRYTDERLTIEGFEIRLDEGLVLRAAAKYGPAIAHVARLYRHLEQAAGERQFEVEVSVDETASPTTHLQHVYIARELRRLGVEWVSLAPRYVGSFEKGVDYIGDVGQFESDFAVHAAIARHSGPYKLSLHSGSDKFSIYAAAARQTRGLVHLKTAGTSYLEALRTVAALDPGLLRGIYAFSRNRFETDRKSYHVSASLEAAPLPGEVDDPDLPMLLEHFDAREILHVTFGSVLGERRLHVSLMELLRSEPEAYSENLRAHFLRHLKPFSQRGPV